MELKMDRKELLENAAQTANDAWAQIGSKSQPWEANFRDYRLHYHGSQTNPQTLKTYWQYAVNTLTNLSPTEKKILSDSLVYREESIPGGTAGMFLRRYEPWMIGDTVPLTILGTYNLKPVLNQYDFVRYDEYDYDEYY
jgi:hypothetical protein